MSDHKLLGHNYTMRHDWYRSMLDRLPELNRELRERTPGLFST